MFVTALLLGLVGVFCILDSRILGRMNFERPLITCTIVGALLGDLQTGLTLGASIELMSLGIVNIGAAAPPDMNMAAIICAAFAILTDASAETALALAIPIAVLGPILAMIISIVPSVLITWFAGKLGYTMGSKYLTKLNGGMMDKLMYVCGIVGLMVIGAMVASMVGLTTPITFASTGLVLQDVLNSILPNLLNLGIVMLMYTLIRKKVKTGWLLGICIVGGVAINALGLLV